MDPEFRYSVRTLVKAPGFTLVAVLSLALGIGVNTAVLAVGRAVLFQPLNVTDPGALVIAYNWRGDTATGLMQINSGGMKDDATGRALGSNFTYPAYTAFRSAVGDRADVFAFTFLRQANVSLGGQSAVGGGMLASGNYFATMGVPMHLGRGLDERDDRPDAEPAAVIGYGLWQRAFGGDGRGGAPSCERPAVHAGRHHRARLLWRVERRFSSHRRHRPRRRTADRCAAVEPFHEGRRHDVQRHERVVAAVMARVRDSADRGAVQAALSTAYARYLSATEGKTFTVEEMPAVTLVGGARATGIDAARLRDAAADARESRRSSARMREHRRADAGPRRRATPRILGPARARRGARASGAARPGREPRAGGGRGGLGVLLALWGSRAMVATWRVRCRRPSTSVPTSRSC